MAKTPVVDLVACVSGASAYIKKVIFRVGISVYTEALEGHKTGDQENEQRRI